jgi:cell division protein FtsI (penicillin-binding protein 3)
MAVLDDGRAKLTDTIHTGNGIWYVANKPMRDHNANRGGYGTITLAEAIHASSNVGISKTIMKAYGAKPSEFVEKLYRMKIADMMNLEIPGTAKPLIKHPKKNPDMWYKTTLAWMSVGYETMMPPIYTLAFYNSIANNGVFVRPRFVKALMKNGQVLKTFEPDIINPAICKPSTIKDLKEVLLGVVEGKKGTAHNVKSNIVRIAGKTGTAQISKGKQGYKAGGKTHQLSFCGYFPADNPQYSCIVVIREPHRGAPSGGKMAGSVFKSIAEQVMLKKSEFSPVDFSKDSTLVKNLFPEIKPGLSKPCIQAMNLLNVKHSSVNAEWVKPELNDSVQQFRPLLINTQLMPDLKGMGAKDALYLLNSLGLKAHISGRGKVISQNLNPGAKFIKGQSIQLVFDN